MMKYLYTLLSIFLCIDIAAQTSDNYYEITKNEAVIDQCYRQIKSFNKKLTQIMETTDNDLIDYYIKACLNLFIGEGNEIKNNNGDVIINAPRIEAMSPSVEEIDSYYIKDYLLCLKGWNCSKIIVTVSDYYLAPEGVRKVGEYNDYDLYSTTVHFCQIYHGYNENVIVFSGEEKKTVEVLIQRYSPDNYNILLGDIRVLSSSPN